MGSFFEGRGGAARPAWTSAWMVAAVLLSGCGGGGGGGGGDAGTADADAPDVVAVETAAGAAPPDAAPEATWSTGTSSGAQADRGPEPDEAGYGIDVCECSAASDGPAS